MIALMETVTPRPADEGLPLDPNLPDITQLHQLAHLRWIQYDEWTEEREREEQALEAALGVGHIAVEPYASRPFMEKSERASGRAAS